ncbi:hypothetical protein TVAG_168390 [Trichomonas vaginalis G3]|uniref:Uncharacterized protein n=1 Tax=Trichomonas vaginalis (strain ATCC PRA-98 / G3) TaxID=412133 RepID=A2F2E2_TRIV3|nr:hypothetical protein TVAGG3_0252850 [Trichomonas vaginalis G3]XP_051113086.1 hypothetical protein TVAGG3_0252910 [Trichomonas vaginalis G3]EAY00908.1 hypothetical protein TVAG_168390 [Trichomonas vaginalis G3]KAI5554141.1 hypothetical protein TVAGG3_0252850 [Trichomonas vaginalis G3]KAI5554147.1 hypothetical protein TVAGG3_0252910 [Trichomonas vaginalis G3]|eukprot:XP_001313837.1 hypothetical protein [Trichomonas vaginalis G3]
MSSKSPYGGKFHSKAPYQYAPHTTESDSVKEEKNNDMPKTTSENFERALKFVEASNVFNESIKSDIDLCKAIAFGMASDIDFSERIAPIINNTLVNVLVSKSTKNTRKQIKKKE